MRWRWLLVVALLIVLGGELAWAAQVDSTPQTTTLRLRRATGVMALVPAVLLWILSYYRRRQYIRAWVAVWFCLATPMFIFSVGAEVLNLGTPEGRAARLAVGRAVSALAILTWLGGMVLLAMSAGWVRGTVRWPRHLWSVAATLAVSLTAAAVMWGLIVVAAALWIGGLASFTWGAIRFLLLARRERFAGALLVGLALLTAPVHALLAQLLSLVGLGVPDRLEIWIMVYSLLALGMHLVVFEDVTYELRRQNAALRDAHAELEAKAVTDALTGCYNRRFFDDIASRELSRHQRYEMPLSVIFFDCDRFKLINDQLGHDSGDRVLAAIGRILRAHVRETDYTFRWGGDEFLVLATCDEGRAAAKAREIRAAFAADPIVAGLPAGTALSAGWMAVAQDATTLLPYVHGADERMYASRDRSIPA